MRLPWGGGRAAQARQSQECRHNLQHRPGKGRFPPHWARAPGNFAPFFQISNRWPDSAQAALGLDSSHMATLPNLAFDSVMPANIDAEKTILGAILLDNSAHSEAAEKLVADDFSLDSHRRIYIRMSELMDSQRAVDIVTLANELARYKEIESVGGRRLPGVSDRGFAAPPGDRRGTSASSRTRPCCAG